MENPTFRLEGVVRSSGEMEDFEGPLTLILQLLAKNKIEIRDIRISELLDQYLAYLDEMKAMDMEIASEFVQMASHLVYIKARMLVSAEEEPDELGELIESLERLRRRDIYARIKAVTERLGEMYLIGAGSITKPPEYVPSGGVYRYSHDREYLMAALIRAFSRENAAAAALDDRFSMPSRIVYPVADKAEEIVAVLTRAGEVRITELLAGARSRTELVAAFIALLELAKAGKIGIIGDGDNVTVTKLAQTG